MMKTPFKASNSNVNVVRELWFDMCTVCSCGFIKLHKHDIEVMNYICYVMPTCAISCL